MRLLVLGGTAFLGRHLVEVSLHRGHEPTLFTRGRTSPDLFPEVEHVSGDRERDLSLLEGREFDAVLDTSGYLPRVVRASAEALTGHVGHYVFVSSLSVYEDAAELTEGTPTWRPADLSSEDVDRDYGGLKALCEEAVETAFPGRSLILRPGLIVGSHDYTGRFSYWPHRVARGGEVLAPGRPETRVWFVDARDLAEWTVRLVEEGTGGVFNATGPRCPLTMGELLDECKALTGSDASFTWVSEEFLLDHGVVPYSDLPLWLPDSGGGYPTVDISRALAAGLTFRPLADTIRCVLAGGEPGREVTFGWTRPRAGLEPARERELLEASR